MADQLNLRSTTFTAGNSWLATYGTNLRDNDLYLGRMRATSGDPVLEQTDCEIGATWVHYTDRLLKTFRLSGTGTADDATRNALASPYRASWHFDDNAGTPPLDNRVVKGDSYIYDTGSDERYKLHYDSVAGAFKGLGVLAEARYVATSTDATTQNRASDRLTMRASRWDTSGTPAAKYRDWSLYSHTSSSAGDGYSLLHIDRRHEGGSWTGVATLDTNGWWYLSGQTPGIELNSGGAGAAYFRVYSSDPDGSAVYFGHGNGTRWARYRFLGTSTGGSGTTADVLGVRYGSAATISTTYVSSPSITHRGSYYVGASSIPDATHYTQLVMTSATPEGYLRSAFDFGVGTFDHYSDGAAVFHIDYDGASAYGGGLAIRASTAANASLPTNHSPYFHAIGRSGSSDANRGIAWNTQIDSSADASDLWSMRMVATSSGAPTDVIGIRHTGEILPADVSGHAIEFTTALGTHAKTTASDKTGNAKVGTIKVKLSDGSTAHLQLYAD